MANANVESAMPGRAWPDQVAEHPQPATAILVVNDMVALGAIAGLPSKSYVALPLTSVRQPLVEVERAICRMSYCPSQDFRFAPMLVTTSVTSALRSERTPARVPKCALRSRS
jgi:hypothetical protein